MIRNLPSATWDLGRENPNECYVGFGKELLKGMLQNVNIPQEKLFF